MKEFSTTIRVTYAGLCGSDMLKLNEGFPIDSFSHKLGHEFVGQVIQSEKKDLIGRNVVGMPVIPCKECSSCLNSQDNLCEFFRAIGRNIDGAFSKFVTLPSENVFLLPNSLSPRLGVLCDIVAVCLHAIYERISSDLKYEALVVGDGAVGVMLSYVLNSLGKNVTLLSKHNTTRTFMQKLSPEIKVTSDKISQSNLFDKVFETVGRDQSETIELSLRHIKKGGEVVSLGVFPINYNLVFNNRLLFQKEAVLTSSVAYKIKYFVKAIDFLTAHPELETIITHEIPFKEFEKGVKMMRQKDLYLPLFRVIYALD